MWWASIALSNFFELWPAQLFAAYVVVLFHTGTFWYDYDYDTDTRYHTGSISIEARSTRLRTNRYSCTCARARGYGSLAAVLP
jgi:hypothetical protein